MPKSFDAVVIGSGQSGPPLAVRLAKSGQTVAIVERARFGGTCVNTGCIPTKTMVASARAVIPAIQGLSNLPYFTNSSFLEIDFLPERLIVVGGSYVGLEFGQMFRRFGCEVTILQRGPRLLRRGDEDISNAVRDIVSKEGI